MGLAAKLIAGCALLCGYGPSFAEQIPSDIGVTMTAAATDQLTVGQPVDVTITVTNYGPNPAPLLVLNSSYYTNAIEVRPQSSSECFFGGAQSRPKGLGAVSVLFWYVAGVEGQRTLEVGETRSCHIQLTLSARAPVDEPLPFSFQVGGAIPPDLNPNNNVSSIVLQLAFPTIPALSAAAILLLIVLLGACGVTTGGRHFGYAHSSG
jgi:Domain of unknown function DUF11